MALTVTMVALTIHVLGWLDFLDDAVLSQVLSWRSPTVSSLGTASSLGELGNVQSPPQPCSGGLCSLPVSLNWLWIMVWAGTGAMLGGLQIFRRFSLLFILSVGTVILFLCSGWMGWQGWKLEIFAPGIAFKGAVLLSRRWFLQQLLERNHQLQCRQQTVTAQNQAKQELLAQISHELRTPLSAILGSSELMSIEPDLQPHHRENLDVIQRTSEHLLSLADELVAFAQLEAQAATLHNRAVELSTLMSNLARMFRFQARKKNLIFRLSVDDRVPKVVWLDEKKLLQILINLLANAFKFTHSGHILVRVWVDNDHPEQPKSWIHFEVEDTGMGIAPSKQKVIFSPFVQGKARAIAPGNSAPGVGLGLSISRKLVESMGGEIWVRSQPNRGSCFQFVLPLELVEVETNEVKTNTDARMHCDDIHRDDMHRDETIIPSNQRHRPKPKH